MEELNQTDVSSFPGGFTPAADDEYLVSLMRARALMFAHFDARDVHITGGNIRFEAGVMRGDPKKLRADFIAAGYTPYIKKYGGRIIVTLSRRKREPDALERRERRTALILFICTVITTLAAGLMQAWAMSPNIKALAFNALSFPAALIFILGSHELAHKAAARRNGIDSTPPYFIPSPFMTGTFGAVIKLKSPMPDDNAAVEMGLSGPIAGFIATIPVLIAGIMLSPHIAQKAAGFPPGAMEFGEPLVFKLIAYGLLRVPPDHVIMIHPLAFAGWVGLLVTMLNLLPVGQLDGGHIARALLGARRHLVLSHLCILGMIAMGAITQYYGWFVWALLCAWIVSRGYPPDTGIIAPLRARNILYGIIGLVIFVLCFMPAPIVIH